MHVSCIFSIMVSSYLHEGYIHLSPVYTRRLNRFRIRFSVIQFIRVNGALVAETLALEVCDECVRAGQTLTNHS